MKVVILAGGFGTILSEETDIKPKPMVEIGDKPIIWHIMKIYASFGYNEFIICLGYKGYMMKEYFSHYYMHESDFTIDLENNSITYHNSEAGNWKITLADTGANSGTGGRIKNIQKYIGNETFMMTYGDGVGDIRIDRLVEFHRKMGKYATLTAMSPTGRFGSMEVSDANQVLSFIEKPKTDQNWINAGFFVLEPEIFNYIDSELTVWEKGPLEKLAKEGQLVAYKHRGFWKPMDTMRDKYELNTLWNSNSAPWKLWKN